MIDPSAPQSTGAAVGNSRSRWERRIRIIHRWGATIFLVTVVVTVIALLQPAPMAWVFYVPLPPLFLLMITGGTMLALPQVRKLRR